MKYFTSRNFKIGSPTGSVYGYGRSIWAMIDTETRQPADILAIHDGLLTAYLDRDYPCPHRQSLARETRRPPGVGARVGHFL